MDQQILDKARRLFELAKKACLLTTESFLTVYQKAKLQKISEGLEGDKKIFMQNNPEIKDSEKLWNEGIDLRIFESVAQLLLDFLQSIHQAFSVAYDQPVEDIIFNFKSVSQDLHISDLGEKQESGVWLQGMKIGEDTFWYQSSSETLVQDVLYDINRHLFPLSKCLLCANFRDQDQYLVVALDLLPEFEEFGFFSV